MSKEAMKLALEFIEQTSAYLPLSFDSEGMKIHAMLKEALANHIPDATKMVSGVKDSLTTQQEQGEPVAGRFEAMHADGNVWITTLAAAALVRNTTPQQRTWVGLTHSDIDQGLLRSDYALKNAEAWRAGVVFAMTKLKEKNGA